MRVTVRFLGLDLIDVNISTAELEAVLDEGYALNGGTTTSYPIQVTQPYGMEPEPWSDYEE